MRVWWFLWAAQNYCVSAGPLVSIDSVFWAIWYLPLPHRCLYVKYSSPFLLRRLCAQIISLPSASRNLQPKAFEIAEVLFLLSYFLPSANLCYYQKLREQGLIVHLSHGNDQLKKQLKVFRILGAFDRPNSQYSAIDRRSSQVWLHSLPGRSRV